MTTIYKSYLSDTTFENLEEFAEYRINMSAALVGGAMDPAVDYNWSISDDGGETYRNPSLNEKEHLERTVWDVRAAKVNCASDCQRRTKVDWHYLCDDCSAIWTHDLSDAEEMKTYGILMNDEQITARVDDLIATQPVEFGKISGLPAVEFWQNARDAALKKLARIREQDNDPFNNGLVLVIVDVKLGAWMNFEFLTVTGDRYGQAWNKWI